MKMMNTRMIIDKTYSDLISIDSFTDRIRYLSLNGFVGDMTFGGHRYLNQNLYRSPMWKEIRNKVILRDNGCDLAHDDHPINSSIYIHHINPITIDDILKERSCVFDLENLVCVSFKTHNMIHYGADDYIIQESINRKPNDTCLWR